MIHLYLLGYKGLKTIQGLEKEYLSYVEHVTIGTDSNIQNDYSKDLITFCKTYRLSHSLNKTSNNVSAKYLMAVGWKWLIDLDITQKIIVFHDSRLPKYRGFNPLVSMLINGEKILGVTAFLATQEFDKGAILAQWDTNISYPIKIQEAIELVSTGYIKLANQVFENIVNGCELKGYPQDEREATYSVWRDEEDYLIDWNQSSTRIKRTIDASGYPYKGSRTLVGDQFIRIDEAVVFDSCVIENPSPGKVLLRDENLPVIICGEGLLKLIAISDLSGKRIPMPKRFKIRLK